MNDIAAQPELVKPIGGPKPVVLEEQTGEEQLTKVRKVALCGTAGTFDEMPWDDLDMEAWGLAWRVDMKRVDRMFEMHQIRANRRRVPGKYIERLVGHGCPVYMIDTHPHIPNSVRYPIEDVIRTLTAVDIYADGRYFASSIAFMIALAIHEKYNEIHLYGIDLADDTEYSYQRPNAEYLVGLARGMGIKVYIPPAAAMCKFPICYGYENIDEYFEGPVNAKLLKKNLAGFNDRKDAALVECYRHHGAIMEMQELVERKLLDGDNEEVKKRMADHEHVVELKRTEANTCDGAAQATKEMLALTAGSKKGRTE